eukprot:gene13611-biopygen2130
MASGDGAVRAPHPVPQNLKNMPFELLEQNIVGHSGDRSKDRAAEEVATFDLGQGARGLRGAMRDLPSTRQSHRESDSAPTRVERSGETVKRLEREMDPDPPEPITFGQYTSAVKGFETGLPTRGSVPCR